MNAFLQDLRYGIRMLAKRPGFTLVAVITLALGIGANTAIFSVINAVLLRALPYPNPDRLLMVWENAALFGAAHNDVAPANFIDLREQNTVFEHIAAYDEIRLNLTGAGEPERIEGRRVSASLFPLLAVEPFLGRAFLPEEDQPGSDSVVILSHGLWQRRFGADPGIIGQAITLNGQATVVVGVMPPSFQFPSRDDELWAPMALSPEEAQGRGDHYFNVVARLKAGVTPQQAQAEMDAIAARLQEQYPRTNTDLGITLVPLHEEFVGDMRAPLLIMLGVVGFVLAVACANVANLLLARASARQKEIAIRAALGASRPRLVRQMLTESCLLAGLGGAAGLLFAFWGVDLLVPLIPDSLSQYSGLSPDTRVLGFACAVSLLTGIVFGLVPALQSSRPNLNEAMKEGGRSSALGPGRNRIHSVLVVSEIALALVLLIGAGLMMKSFLRLINVNPGFQPEQLLTMRVELPMNKYSTPERRSAFYDQVIERAQAVPGVQSAAMISYLPITPAGIQFSFSIEGRTQLTDRTLPGAVFRVISPDYFRTMGIPLLTGRPFDRQDRRDAPPVVIINRQAAQTYWPGEDMIGKRLKVGPPDSPNPWAVIVGVVGDVKHNKLDDEPKPQMYVPYQQDWRPFVAPRDLIVRATADPASLAAAVRDAIWAVDKDQPVSNIQTMERVISVSAAQPRFQALLLGIFAAIALLLAGVGIYGVLAYSVSQRTHEIGLRMALGAKGRDVLKMVIRQGVTLALIGVGIGLAAAYALTRVLKGLLYKVSATDPTTFAALSLMMVAVALLACYLPARRATKVDPMVALRCE